MSKVIFRKETFAHLKELDTDIAALNNEKVRLILGALDEALGATDLEKMLGWELILVSVPDKQMAIQLNKLSAYVPNLKFVVDTGDDPLTFRQGKKGRRVWKDR